MLGVLVIVLLSLGAGISSRSVEGDGKRWLFDDSAMNGGSSAVDDHDWFTGGRNPGKRNIEDKRCLNLFTDGCSNGNGPGLVGDENAAGQVGKREADLMQNPKLYNKLLAYLYYNKKIEENNQRLGGDAIPDERTFYGFPH